VANDSTLLETMKNHFANSSKDLHCRAGDIEIVAKLGAFDPASNFCGVLCLYDVSAIVALQNDRARWMSFVTHDLRAPLARILYLLDTGGANAEQLRAQATRALTLSDDFTVLALLDGQFHEHITGVEWRQLVESAVQNASDGAAAPEAQIELSWLNDTLENPSSTTAHDDIVLRVAVRAIERVLQNLLLNASEHGDCSKPIRVQCSYSEYGAEIRIENGIVHEISPQVEAPEKIGIGTLSAQKKAAGRGLGLTFCRRVLEAHGSELLVTATPTSYAASFSLPLTT
jgi:signal transduction histidine kinase